MDYCIFFELISENEKLRSKQRRVTHGILLMIVLAEDTTLLFSITFLRCVFEN